MIIQLQPEQVSEYWEMIKHGAASAMGLAYDHAYTNNLFIALLNNTHQCWLIFNDEREVQAMGIACVIEENLTGRVHYHIDAFYSYSTLTDELALEAKTYVSTVARQHGCTSIRALTDNPRAMRLLELLGFKAEKSEYLLYV